MRCLYMRKTYIVITRGLGFTTLVVSKNVYTIHAYVLHKIEDTNELNFLKIITINKS